MKEGFPLKKNSLLKKVLLNNLLIMIIPFLLILFTICYFFCHAYKEDETRTMTNLVNEYANELNEQIDSTLHRSNFIMKSDNILNGISVKYQNVNDTLRFINEVNIFMDNLTNSESSVASIKLFTTNQTLFNSKYIDHMENLPNIDEIKNRFKKEKTDILWDEYISADAQGNKFFTIYRKPSLKDDCLIVCYVTFPAFPSYSQDIMVSHFNTEFNAKKYVTAEVRKLFTVAVPYNYSKIYLRYFEYIIVFSLLAVIFLVFMCFITYNVNKNILSEIDNVIVRLAENDEFFPHSELPSNPKEPEEISVIKKTINSLINKVEESIESVYIVELEKRKAELNLLQSKLGPHILYNSLSVIKLNVLENKNENSLKLIDDLVSYYRSILNYGKDIITVKDEIEMTQKYVKIYEQAHDKEYALTIDVPSEIMQLKVMHLILQPFIENAIIHGLSGSRENCKINIKARTQNDLLIFEITDNGYGISVDKLKELKHMKENESSYGLKNTYERLKLFYPEKGDLNFESSIDHGTKVTIISGYTI